MDVTMTMNPSRFLSLYTVLFATPLLMSGRSEGSYGFGICPSKDGTRIVGEYDSSHEICCDGSIKSKRDYLCCNNKVYQRTVRSFNGHSYEEQICCGTRLVKKSDNHLCCEDNLIELNDTEAGFRNYLKCCGKGYYVIGELKICCGGSTIPLDSPRIGCCGGDIYDKYKERCVASKRLLPFEGICNDSIYDKTSASCCGVTLNTKVPEKLKKKNGSVVPNPAFGCCGEEVMDPQKEKCCPANIYRLPSHTIPKGAHIQCCGHGSFDTNNEFCINNTSVKRGPYQEQCGSFVYDSRTHGCCNDKLPYNNETHKCCQGSWYCILPKEGKCCNGYPVNDDELCCQSMKPCKKRDKDDDECCYNRKTGEGITYKSNNQTKCRRGRIVPRIKVTVSSVSRYTCGLFTSYSPEHEICCIDKKYPRTEGYVRCCGDKGLKQNEECFGKEVQRRIIVPPFVRTKCGAHSINKAGKRCCGSQFPYNITSGRKACCSDRELYDKRFSKCTEDGRVEPITSHSKFCRSRIFDGAIGQACVRKYAFVGKVKKVKAQTLNSSTVVTMYLRNVRSIRRSNGLPVSKARSLVVEIQTDLGRNELCLKYYNKRSKKFMIFFDEPLKGNQVQIFKQSPFFITKYTRRRVKDVRRGIKKKFCAFYENHTL